MRKKGLHNGGSKIEYGKQWNSMEWDQYRRFHSILSNASNNQYVLNLINNMLSINQSVRYLSYEKSE